MKTASCPSTRLTDKVSFANHRAYASKALREAVDKGKGGKIRFGGIGGIFRGVIDDIGIDVPFEIPSQGAVTDVLEIKIRRGIIGDVRYAQNIKEHRKLDIERQVALATEIGRDDRFGFRVRSRSGRRGGRRRRRGA